jgi:hypothetical protein
MRSTHGGMSRRPVRKGLLTAALLVALVPLASGCTMRRHYGPDFKRFSREHPFAVRPATHRAGPLELTVKSGAFSEVYTVIGSESFTARVQVRVANAGDQPLVVGSDDMGAIRSGSPGPTAVYFNDVSLPPRGEADLVISIPSGTMRLTPPTALVYQGVRMEL